MPPAPLGEWSLVATVVDGARGMPGTVALCNRPGAPPIPSAADPPSPAADGEVSRDVGVVHATFADGVAVLLGEGLELAQREGAAAPCLGNVDAGPESLGAR